MFTLRVKTDNATFGNDPRDEVARILAEVATRIGDGATEGRVRDENGNTVGSFTLTRGRR